MTIAPASAFDELLREKEVIVDTSSLLLAGVNLLTFLPKCHLVIPAIVVKELEEKRSHPTLGYPSREWLRLLEELRVEFGVQLSKGVPLNTYPQVTLRIEPNHSNQSSLPLHLRDGSNDSTILAVAANLSFDGGTVLVLSNDVPMRLHATLDLGLEASEFNASLIISAKPFDGCQEVTLPPAVFASTSAVKVKGGRPLVDVVSRALPQLPSHALVSVNVEGVKGNPKAHVSEFLYTAGNLSPVKRKQRVYGLTARTLEQDVALHYLLTPPEELPIVSLGGSAGTGKTLLSVAAGLQELKAGHYQKMVVFRSLHEMGTGQELGFLPGDVNEKMAAWAGAVYDALDVLASVGKPKGQINTAESKRLRELVEVSPITFLRGRSLSNSYIILEEAQNFSRNEILNILSRAGEGTKMVLTGDPDQVDSKYLQSGDKADVWSVIASLKNEDIFAHITLKRTERSRVAEVTSRLLASQ